MAQSAIQNWNITFPFPLLLQYAPTPETDSGASIAKRIFDHRRPRLLQIQSSFRLSLIHKIFETLGPWCASWLPSKDSRVHQPSPHVPPLPCHRQGPKWVLVGSTVWAERDMLKHSYTRFRCSHEDQRMTLDCLTHLNYLLTTLLHPPARNWPDGYYQGCRKPYAHQPLQTCSHIWLLGNQKPPGGVICVKTL